MGATSEPLTLPMTPKASITSLYHRQAWWCQRDLSLFGRPIGQKRREFSRKGQNPGTFSHMHSLLWRCICKPNDTHTHAAWTQRRMARRERAKRYLAFKRGAADSQARSHLMPGHLPSVCWIIPLACSTTGTSLNTPVKYKKHTEQNALTHTHTQKERKKGCSYKQLAEICASQGGWQEEGSARVRGGRGDPDSLESRFFRQWIRAKLTSATARVR